MAERLNLTVEDGVGEMLAALAGGERRRGQWLSDLVQAMHTQQETSIGNDLETMKFAVAGLAGQQKMIEARLLRVEQQLGQQNGNAGK